MKIILLILIFSLTGGVVYSSDDSAQTLNQHGEIKLIWNQFLMALQKRDIKGLKNLSASTIDCMDCLDNTQKESDYMHRFRETDPDWYEKLYTEMIFIPKDVFFKKDYPLFFTQQFIEILHTAETTFHQVSTTKSITYNVLVTTTKPGEVHPRHEGGQHVFQFARIDNDYKFNGLYRVP